MKTYAWKVFLLIYFGILLVHVFETGFTLSGLPVLLVGLIGAIIAHRSTHVLSLLFLVAHMTIEAIEYRTVGVSFTALMLTWVAVHVLMDITFLWGEVKRHFFSVRYQMWSSIMLGIACIYLFIPHAGGVQEAFTTTYRATAEFLVLGGVIGCVLSHLLPHRHAHE